MILARRMAWIFTGFSCLVLGYNFVVIDNPDHMMNVIEQSGLMAVFASTTFLPVKLSQLIHILSMVIASLVAASTDTGFFSSAILMVFTFVLSYAYGGFKTFAAWKLPFSAAGAFVVCLAGSSHFKAPAPQVWTRAAMWVLFIALFLGLLWLVLQEVRRMFYQDFASELVQQNHDLLKEVQRLTKGCDDGDPT